jgi:hypothetical protein
MQQTSATDGRVPASIDGLGHIFSLTLLGQYAAQFSAGADRHDGGLFTHPPVSGPVALVPVVVPHS